MMSSGFYLAFTPLILSDIQIIPILVTKNLAPFPTKIYIEMYSRQTHQIQVFKGVNPCFCDDSGFFEYEKLSSPCAVNPAPNKALGLVVRVNKTRIQIAQQCWKINNIFPLKTGFFSVVQSRKSKTSFFGYALGSNLSACIKPYDELELNPFLPFLLSPQPEAYPEAESTAPPYPIRACLLGRECWFYCLQPSAQSRQHQAHPANQQRIRPSPTLHC